MKKIISALALIGVSAATGGCALLAAGGAGYMVHDEATENDGRFDPLEDVRDDGDGKN